MNGENKMREEQGLAAEWEDLTGLAEECPEEAEIIMEMLIDADDVEDDVAGKGVAA